MNAKGSLKTIIVIPSRYGSTRFPGKPLSIIKGQSLLQRVWSLAQAVAGVDEVYVATDHERIRQHAASFGAKAIMTRADCKNGTERVHDVVRQLKPAPDIIVNFQGDAVLTPPHIIESLILSMAADPMVQIATPAVRLTDGQWEELRRIKATSNTGGTFVVFGQNHDALYFSKALIPHVRKPRKDAPLFRHIGMYAYRAAALERFVQLSPTPLEEVEQLEQLRALEHGISIRVVEVEYGGRTAWSIDTPEDVIVAEELIEREGEILAA